MDFSSTNSRGDENTLGKWTALHECVRSNKTETLKILLENGAKVDITDIDGETPLFVASTSRNAETVRILLNAGANPNARAGDGWTCVMMAARDGDYDVTKGIVGRRSGSARRLRHVWTRCLGYCESNAHWTRSANV